MKHGLAAGSKVLRCALSPFGRQCTVRVVTVIRVTKAGYVHADYDRFRGADFPLRRVIPHNLFAYKVWLEADTPQNRAKHGMPA